MVERAGFEPAYGKPGQIYSLLPLTTRPPLHEGRPARTAGQWGKARHMASRLEPVNASKGKECRPLPRWALLAREAFA